MPNIKPIGIEKVKKLFDDVHSNKSKGFRFSIVKGECKIDDTSVLPEDHKTPFQTLVLSDEVKNSTTCYIVVNILYIGQSARVFDEIVLFSWSNDDVTGIRATKEKTQHASAEHDIKKSTVDKNIVKMRSIDEICVDTLFDEIIGTTGEKPTEFEGRFITYDEDRREYSFAADISS